MQLCVKKWFLKESETRTTASVLKQDPNTWKVKQSFKVAKIEPWVCHLVSYNAMDKKLSLWQKCQLHRSWASFFFFFFFLLFIDEEQTRLAAPWGAQIWSKKVNFCCMIVERTTTWSLQMELFVQIPHFQFHANLHLHLVSPTTSVRYGGKVFEVRDHLCVYIRYFVIRICVCPASCVLSVLYCSCIKCLWML